MARRYNSVARKAARLRWSRNAVRKREWNRLARSNALIECEPSGKCFVPRRLRPDIKVILERGPGERIQFSLNFLNGQLVGETVAMAPKQFGRRLGDMFHLWCMA